MSILFVNTSWTALFDASNCGPSNRSNLFIEALSLLDEVDVVSFRDEEHSTLHNCHVIYGEHISNSADGNKLSRYKKIKGLFTGNVYDYTPIIQARASVIRQCLEKKNYDIIATRYFFDAISCGLFEYRDRLVLDTDDNIISRAFKQINLSSTSKISKFFHKLILKRLSPQIDRMLSEIPMVFHSNSLEKHVPNSVFLHNLSTITSELHTLSEAVPLRIVMVGDFRASFNTEGVVHFVKSVWPKVMKSMPEAEFHVVGANMDDGLRSTLEGAQNVFVKGFVKNLEEEYRNCRVVAVPIYSGSGTSVKTIEAMAVGRPVVSTPIGIRGFSQEMIEGEDYILAKDDDEFATGIIALLSDIDKSRKMAANAYAVFNRNWSKEKFISIVHDTVMSRKMVY